MNCLAAEETPWDPRVLAATLHRCLHVLDHMERESTGERVAAVADIMARSADIPGWSAFSADGGDLPRMVLRHLLRPISVPSEHFDVPLEWAVGGAGMHATATSGPEPLRRRVESSGLREILVVGGYAPDAAPWVLAFYADHMAPALIPLLPTLYAVTQAALSFPQAVRPRRDARGFGSRLSLVDPEPHCAGYAD